MYSLVAGTIPYYLQIEAILRDQIASGEFGPNAVLPTEKKICEQYGVSRPTARQAVKKLEEDGLVVRERGKRTRVTERPKEKILPLKILEVEDLVHARSADKIVLADTGSGISPPFVQSAFGFDEPAEIFSFVRVYYSGGVPYSASKTYLLEDMASSLNKKDFVAKNFLKIFSKKCKIIIIESKQRIDAILAAPSMASYLEVKPGTPVLSIRRTSLDENRVPIEHSHTLIRSERGKLQLELEPNPNCDEWRLIETS